MSLCHCVYKTYYRYFAFKNMSLKEYVSLSLCLQNILSFLCLKKYVIKRICLSVIVFTKYTIVPLSLNNMSLCLCNVICTLVLIYKVSRY